jgi:hypothetical protein
VNGRTPYFLLRRKKKKAKVKNLFILDEEKASWKKYSYELPLHSARTSHIYGQRHPYKKKPYGKSIKTCLTDK